MKNNIRAVRKARRLSLEHVASRVPGLTPATLSRREIGQTKVTLNELQALSELFGCTLEELISGEPGSATIPMVGYVGAGEQIFPIDDNVKGEGLDRVECPHNINPEKGLAVEVRGDSMEPLISEGFLLYYEERLPGVPVEFMNRICLIWLEDGSHYVKRIQKGTTPGHYDLASINPLQGAISDAKVLYSAFVKTMVQR